jgi:hypothetical protein
MIQTILKNLRGNDSKREGLSVICTDNYNPESSVVKRPPTPFIYYYRTEVHNTLNVPLRITWFNAFHRYLLGWTPRNILGRPLDGRVFSAWYSDGIAIIDGLIPPKESAVCGTNWHGSSSAILGPVKWAYRAVDPSGAEYYAEVILERQIVFHVRL